MKKTFQFLGSLPNIYRVDYPYRLFLHKADSNVSLKNDRPFYGVIITIDQFHYLIPLTSQSFRSNGKRRNPRTTVEILDENDECIAALLINNMIPVPPVFYEEFDFKILKSAPLFNKELLYMRRPSVQSQILRKAETVYHSVINHTDPFLNRFCCDFEKLEQLSMQYRIQESPFFYHIDPILQVSNTAFRLLDAS